MPKVVQPLKDAKISAAKPRDRDYKLADGGGLFCLIKHTGSKLWQLKYKKPDGREGLASFGAYPVVTLADARFKRIEFLRLLGTGVDPLQKSKVKEVNRFESVAKAWHAAQKKWSLDHSQRVWRRFEIHILPAPALLLFTADL